MGRIVLFGLFVIIARYASISADADSLPLVFYMANLVYTFDPVLANQFLSCLCEDESPDCAVFGQLLNDNKTYQMLSVNRGARRGGNKIVNSPFRVRNCVSFFSQENVVITCSQVSKEAYETDGTFQDQCMALKHTRQGDCIDYVGIVWNLVAFRIKKDDTILEEMSCLKAFLKEKLKDKPTRTEPVDRAIVVSSIALGVIFMVVFLVIQYIRPRESSYTVDGYNFADVLV